MAKNKYCVTVIRYGYVFVEAESESEAMDIADHQTTETINWSDDWSPSSASENDEQPDNAYIREKAF